MPTKQPSCVSYVENLRRDLDTCAEVVCYWGSICVLDWLLTLQLSDTRSGI